MILVAGVVVLLFLASFSVWSLFRQYAEIAKFTSGQPVPVPMAAMEGREAEVNALAAKLEAFRQSLTDHQDDTRLVLTPDEINLAIAAYEPLKPLRHTFHVTAVEGDALKVAISFRLNGKPRLARRDEPGITAADPRFLNATLTARPKVVSRELVLDILAIEVPGASVPAEFIGHFSPYRVADSYREHPVIGPVMAKLTSATIADGAVALNRLAAETPGGEISRDDVNHARDRFFAFVGIGASIFLAFVGLIVFIGLRAKARNGQARV
jgi:hypothetical protein